MSTEQEIYGAVMAAVMNIAAEHMRPSVLYRPTMLRMEGGRWRASYGSVVSYGDTPDQAMLHFDAVWVSYPLTGER